MQFQKKRPLAAGTPLKNLATYFLTAILLPLSMQAIAQSATVGNAPAPFKVKLFNSLPFSEASITDFLSKTLPETHKSILSTGKYTLLVSTSHFELKGGKNYCIATLAVTHASPDERNIRWPSTGYYSVARHPSQSKLNAEQINDCQSNSLRTVVGRFSERDPAQFLRNVDDTLPLGGKRMAEAPSELKAHVFAAGLDEQAKREVFGAVPHDFRKRFDYRHVQWFVDADSVSFEDEIVCFANAGVAARSPGERNPRHPATWETVITVFDATQAKNRGANETCKQEAAVAAVNGRLSKSWDENGIFKDFSKTREDGLSLPNMKAVVSPAKQQPRVGQTSTQANSCTVSCVNGNCVRTWPNGKTERFQAPRKLNPMTGQWEWDTSGC